MDFLSDLFGGGDPAVEAMLETPPENVIALDQSIAVLRAAGAGDAPDAPRGAGAPPPAPPHLVFQLASSLIAHSRPELVREGLQLTEGLLMRHWARRSVPHKYDEAGAAADAAGAAAAPLSDDLLPSLYYFSAIAWLKLDDVTKARAMALRMLDVAPRHPQGEALLRHIEGKLRRDGVVGLAGLAVAGVAAVAALRFMRR